MCDGQLPPPAVDGWSLQGDRTAVDQPQPPGRNSPHPPRSTVCVGIADRGSKVLSLFRPCLLFDHATHGSLGHSNKEYPYRRRRWRKKMRTAVVVRTKRIPCLGILSMGRRTEELLPDPPHNHGRKPPRLPVAVDLSLPTTRRMSLPLFARSWPHAWGDESVLEVQRRKKVRRSSPRSTRPLWMTVCACSVRPPSPWQSESETCPSAPLSCPLNQLRHQDPPGTRGHPNDPLIPLPRKIVCSYNLGGTPS